MDQCMMKDQDLQREINKVFGNKYDFLSLVRLYGGAQKGTYKITCKNQFEFILHIWDESVSYFDHVSNDNDTFTSNSAVLFMKNQKLLKDNNISTPEIYYVDLSKESYEFEFAFVEYIEGSDLETLLYRDGKNCEDIMLDLRENISRMHMIQNNHPGDLLNAKEDDFLCEKYVQQQISKNLEYLFDHFEPVRGRETEVLHMNQLLYGSIETRRTYSLIHWELGPNHVMVNKKDQAYLIDIEGMKYFDLEYEHSFLELRFGEYYKYLKREDLDMNRMNFYRFNHYIANITGAHQLLMKNYYDREDVEGMISYNYAKLEELLK